MRPARRLPVLAALASALVAVPTSAAAATLLADDFDQPDGLVTNAYAFWNPGKPDVAESPIWAVHSGSLFAKGGMGWTGVPDDAKPDRCSCNGNGSAVLRAATKRTDFGDVTVSFDLVNRGLSSTTSTPPEAWDGLHVWLRYQSEYSLYYATVNRRDDTVIIKKKVPGGPASSNYGTYYDLSPAVRYTVPYGRAQHVSATVRTNGDGSVGIALSIDGRQLVEAIDRDAGGTAPLTQPGAVGLRGDNADLLVDNFRVTDDAAPGGASAGTGASAPARSAPGTGAADPAPPSAAPAGTPAAAVRSARLLRGHRVRLVLACAGARGATCRGSVVVATRAGRALGRRAFSLGAGRRRAVVVRLRSVPRRVRALARTSSRAGVVTRDRPFTLRRS